MHLTLALARAAISLFAVAALPSASALGAGNPDGHAPVPVAARALDTSHPDRVIGDGTPASCTSRKVVAAVARGGGGGGTGAPSTTTAPP